MSIVYPQFVALFIALYCTVALSNSREQVVTDCIQLQEALNKDHISTVVVRGAIRCTRESWKVPIVVQRNVELAGDRAERNATEELPSIDWTDTSHVVIVERASLSVHDLVMYQNSVGLSGIRIAFVHTREGAAAVFTGVVLVVQQCAQNVRTYLAVVSEIPRPNFLTGEQYVQTIGANVLLMQDVAIWWPNLNSVWQLCNTAVVCLDGYQGRVPLEEYFTSGLVVNTCSAIARTNTQVLTTIGDIDIVVSDPELEEPEMEPEGEDGHDATSTLIVVAVVIAGVMFITAVLSYKFICGRSYDPTKSVYSRREQSSMEGGSPRDGTSSRHLANKNDMDLDLFERGTNVPLQDVVMGTLLGRGGFGKVYKGTWKGTAVAIKVIEHGERLLQNDLKLPFEAYLSRHISHPNVVQTFLIHTRQKDSPNGITVDTLDLQADSPGSGKRSLSRPSLDVFSNMAPYSTAGHDAGDMFQTWLVLEFCDRGSLSKAIRKGELLSRDTDAPLLDHILLSALDVANAMNYLHSLGITHGDLKAENVLLKSASTDRRGFFCKVSDFGMSRYVGETDCLQTFTYGTISHMPPELLKDGAFSTAVDIYSFGILLWELLATEPPYSDKHTGHIMMAVVSEGKRPHITDRYPQMYADLMKDCWKQRPEDRPKFAVIVRRLKGMLADLEIGNAMLRNVNDSATSHDAPINRRQDASREPFAATLPDELNPSSSRPPRVMFVSEPTSFHPRPDPDQPPPSFQWPQRSRQYSTDSTGSLSTSPLTSQSGFSDFSQET